MGGKSVIVLGLVAGVVVGGLLVGGLVALTPGPASPVNPTPAASGPPPATAPPSTPPPPAPSTSAPESTTPAPPPTAPAAPASSDPSPSSGTAAFGIGEVAPPLVVPLLGGGTADLASYRGKPVWVNFMATWCPSCADELPLMAGYAARYAESGLEVLPVDVREDEAAVQALFDAVAPSLTAGLDQDGAAQAAWDALALPVHFWIDADGIVRDGALGAIGPDVMARGLQAILPGEIVTP